MFPFHDLKKLDIIVVNQTNKSTLLKSNEPSVKVLNSFEKGLSRSRNLALKNASANWCLIADDDVVYLKKFEEKIKSGIFTFLNSGLLYFKLN